MSDVNKEAFKQAEKELQEDRVKLVKDYILETLKKIETKKQEKAKVEEELSVLKLNLEDLRNGRFEKLEERIEKSKLAREVSPFLTNPPFGVTYAASTFNWLDNTSGTYLIGSRTIYL